LSKGNTHIEQLTDLELVNSFKKNREKSVLGVLYKRYMSLVYGLCLKYLKDRAAAQDMTMQVFEKLINDLHKHDVANFKSWLYVMAKNECLMFLRSQNRQKVHSTENLNGHVMEIPAAVHHEDENALEADLTKLETCISQLNDEQQQCIKLFYLERKCYQEVSDQTGFALKKVKSFIQNGRRNLKICVETLREQEQ
jgi:RNA polymerase sigma factor (sigma-70 family)